MGDLPDFQAPLGKFSNRRSSVIFSAKLIQKWSERPENQQPEESQSNKQADDGCKKPGTISFSNFEEYTPDNLNKAIIMGPDMDDKTECRPCKMSVDDMTEVLFECINEESLRREAMTGVAPPKSGMRRGSVSVIRPESSSVLEDARKLTEYVNKIVSMSSDDIKAAKEKRKMCARQIATEMAKFIGDDMKTVLDLDESFIEDPE